MYHRSSFSSSFSSPSIAALCKNCVTSRLFAWTTDPNKITWKKLNTEPWQDRLTPKTPLSNPSITYTTKHRFLTPNSHFSRPSTALVPKPYSRFEASLSDQNIVLKIVSTKLKSESWQDRLLFKKSGFEASPQSSRHRFLTQVSLSTSSSALLDKASLSFLLLSISRTSLVSKYCSYL